LILGFILNKDILNPLTVQKYREKAEDIEDSAQMVPLVAVNMVPLIALNMVPGVALNMVPGLDALQER
jgi:hypothetical protein